MNETFKHLKKLKHKKVCGIDNLPPRFLNDIVFNSIQDGNFRGCSRIEEQKDLHINISITQLAGEESSTT